MAELKTRETADSVSGFLKKIADPGVRKDSATLITIMKSATRAGPKVWGTAIIGFGNLRYKYASGREGDWFLTGFAPRKDKLSLYLMCGLEPLAPLLKKLGAHKRSGSCLHIKRLDDVDLPTLRKIVAQALVLCRKKYKAAG